MEICPLAADWGNWADWAAVFVGSVAALGTIWVATLANGTSKRAAEIAEEAKTIAQQQHKEAVYLREAQARILGRQLLYEVLAVPARLSALSRRWGSAVTLEDPPNIVNGTEFLRVLKESKVPLLPGAQRVEDRIHNLPDSLGADLATLIGGTHTLYELTRKVQERVKPATPAIASFRYAGDPDDLKRMHYHLNWLHDLSSTFAADFERFVITEDPVLSRRN